MFEVGITYKLESVSENLSRTFDKDGESKSEDPLIKIHHRFVLDHLYLYISY
jgi:hypothetical protein